MRKCTLAVVGIVATLSTFSQGAQLSARTLSTSLVTVDSALVEKIASQVEDSFWSKVKVYAEHNDHDHAEHHHHNHTEHSDNQTAAETSYHQLPPNVMRNIGKYLRSELETDRSINALSSAIKEDAEFDWGGVQNFFQDQARKVQDHFRSETGAHAVSE
jgi:hypothetical protein